MDNVIAVVLFLVFVVGGLIKNYRENQETHRRANERPLRKEDLPEATRRQIYGDENVPTRTATVREATPQRTDGPLPSRPVLDPAERTARELIETLFGDTVELPKTSAQTPPVQRREPATALPPQLPPSAWPRRLATQTGQALARRAAAQPVVVQQSRRVVIETQGGPPPPPKTTRPAGERAKAAPVAAAAPSGKQRTFDFRLGSNSDIRRAIVLAEILGPPRADRPFLGGIDSSR